MKAKYKYLQDVLQFTGLWSNSQKEAIEFIGKIQIQQQVCWIYAKRLKLVFEGQLLENVLLYEVYKLIRKQYMTFFPLEAKGIATTQEK